MAVGRGGVVAYELRHGSHCSVGEGERLAAPGTLHIDYPPRGGGGDLLEPFHLATTEFFQLCRDRLTPGGILALNVERVPGDDSLPQSSPTS